MVGNMFASSYGFNDLLAGSTQKPGKDFLSLDRPEGARKQQPGKKQLIKHMDQQFGSPLQQKGAGGQCVSLRLNQGASETEPDQAQTPILRENIKQLYSQMKETPTRPKRQERKNSVGKRTLNYSQMEQQTRN
jgi:hypothetical protein